MITTIGGTVLKQKRKLYRQFVKDSPYAAWNKSRIDYVLNNVYKKQLKIYNSNEEKVISRLKFKNIIPEVQKLIPIQSEGGKLQHLYIADIVVGNTIIEVDGPQHKEKYDSIRDQNTSKLGYKTIRIPTSDLSKETIDNYLQELD